LRICGQTASQNTCQREPPAAGRRQPGPHLTVRRASAAALPTRAEITHGHRQDDHGTLWYRTASAGRFSAQMITSPSKTGKQEGKPQDRPNRQRSKPRPATSTSARHPASHHEFHRAAPAPERAQGATSGRPRPTRLPE